MTSMQDVTDLGPEDSSESARDAEFATNLASPTRENGDLQASEIQERVGVETQAHNGIENNSEVDGGSDATLGARRNLSQFYNGQEAPSTPDDTPSIQDSTVSSPSRRPRLGSPNPSLKPFDRRFKARLSASPLDSPRAVSPAFLSARSRQSSAISHLLSDNGDLDTPDAPWDVVRWTRLRKLSGEAFSEVGKRNYGRPTCMAVASLIAIGTSKGLILIFDYHQDLKATIGVGTKAVESGSVTAVALSADFSVVAGGHSNGNIFTWEIARPAKPFLQILSLPLAQLQNSPVDGHVSDVSILHLGFLGTRHTALVSADDRGMAFSHLATRGLGAIARSVRTTRILGRYPELGMPARARKPSSVLAFALLPLGNLESRTDGLGLVAMLTPYLLVVVSTTPVAQTQHKASRPKELAAHGAMTAALAWYPAMKTKTTSTNAKLAYCWLNFVTIIEVEEIQPSEDSQKDAPVDLHFKHLANWQADESIVAMQWLNRSVLAILTLTQQLIILEDNSLSVTDSMDLVKKHVYHTDLFSQHLGQLIESLDEENVSMHGVVADAFYMSFRAYKGRLLLLGFNDVSIGSLSNWADRLLALMEQGDFIGAIQLATSYYASGAEKAAIGLPMDDKNRHDLVQEKLTEMMSASLRYAFGKNPDTDTMRISETQLEHLARACFAACLQLNDMDFLFEEVYAWYSESSAGATFLRTLETSIIEGDIKSLPPILVKDLVNDFVESDRSSRLEEILCLLDPRTMDLDQMTLLCKNFKLYDALFYIWSQAIGDYTTILKDLLEAPDDVSDEADTDSSSKIFPYLSYTLTGRIYPTGEWLADDVDFKAKAEVYHFFFSGSSNRENVPYYDLRRALDLDASSFLSMLNEAFEDTFLDESESPSGSQTNGMSENQRFATSLTRQYVIQVLLKVVVPPHYEPEDIIYLDMFIARNQPKFPQFIRLPGSTLQQVLIHLCNYPSEDIAEDSQLSLEYLLSVYQPPDLYSLIPLLQKARFFRVIKSIYRSEKQYSLLLETCFQDVEHPDGIFESIADYLKPSSNLNDNQRSAMRQVIVDNASNLLSADLQRAAVVISAYAPELHSVMIDNLEQDDQSQYQYLREVLEPKQENQVKDTEKSIQDSYIERYVRLLCDFDPHHVTDYVNRLDSSNLRLDEILPALESSGVIDAAVILMTKDGKVREAMDRLTQHLRYLEVALISLLDSAEDAPDEDNAQESAEDLLESVEKYSKVGVWLCKKQTNLQARADKTRPANKRLSRMQSQVLGNDLASYETLWLDLIDAVVRIARTTGEVLEETTSRSENESTGKEAHHKFSHLSSRLRNVVQDTFTALLAATSVPTSAGDNHSNLSFLRILRAFLTRVSESSPSLVHLRSVLSAVFSAYEYEENLLALANRLLDKDLFVRVEEVSERRKRGWRPSGQTCNSCGIRVWGPGAGVAIWDTWFDKQDPPKADNQYGSGSKQSYRGKGKAVERNVQSTDEATSQSKIESDALVIFSCRHAWHRRCLEAMLAKGESKDPPTTSDPNQESGTSDGTRYFCPLEKSVESFGPRS